MRSKTDLLTIKFQEKDQPIWQPIKAFIIHKMKDNFKPCATEKWKYKKDIIVTFQKCGVIDTDWMVRNYLPHWGRTQDKGRFAIYDSATAHVTQAIEDGFARSNASIAVILGGLIAILQSLDCDFIFVYRHHYQHVADEWACRTQILSSMRILGTHFTNAAYKHALSVVTIAALFKKRGYMWPVSDGGHINLRELPAYRYDPNDALIWFRPKRVLESQNANEHHPARKQAQDSSMQLWKK